MIVAAHHFSAIKGSDKIATFQMITENPYFVKSILNPYTKTLNFDDFDERILIIEELLEKSIEQIDRGEKLLSRSYRRL
jgi:hypothetical protein